MECGDENTSPGRDHALNIRKRISNFQVLSGEVNPVGTSIKVVYGGARPEIFDTPGPRRASVLPALASDNILATRVLNGTNPSRPDVDLGVTLAELREAPQLLFSAGKSLLQNGANFWLSYSFGWKPLVNDMLDLLDVPPKIDQRVAYLEKAAREGGMRRRTDLESQVGTKLTDNVAINSTFGYVLRTTRKASATRRVWGTVRYTPSLTKGRFPRTDAERLKAARRASLGLLIDPATAWELIPWSWLLDYFGTMGQVLGAYRNTVGLNASAVCIMKTTEHIDRFEPRTDSFTQVSGGTGSKRETQKVRSVIPFVLPELYQPILSPGQLSNLGALGVNRIPKDILRLKYIIGDVHI
jgi:hypothetical protein